MPSFTTTPYDVQFHCNTCGCTFYPSEASLVRTGKMAQCPGCGCITASQVYIYKVEVTIP